MSGPNSLWTTNDELKFVQRLATMQQVAQRRPLLEGYLAGFRRRVNWGDIGPQAVREAAEKALEFLQ
ncbi:MAG: hypothetical protein MUC53_08350 [Candidatus Contendobacter sp.]|jgi:hypothetical protein|nr:hypothetical protein [Candidatus Contendobacter sp.]